MKIFLSWATEGSCVNLDDRNMQRIVIKNVAEAVLGKDHKIVGDFDRIGEDVNYRWIVDTMNECDAVLFIQNAQYDVKGLYRGNQNEFGGVLNAAWGTMGVTTRVFADIFTLGLAEVGFHGANAGTIDQRIMQCARNKQLTGVGFEKVAQHGMGKLFAVLHVDVNMQTGVYHVQGQVPGGSGVLRLLKPTYELNNEPEAGVLKICSYDGEVGVPVRHSKPNLKA